MLACHQKILLWQLNPYPANMEDDLLIQWNLDLSFFKGMEKQNDECGKTINPGNYYIVNK
jgi:hypothetical protein